jgi:4-carboxymuconolactone decarboxylase
MARIPPPNRDDLSPEGQRIYDQMVSARGNVRGPYTVLMHYPALAERVSALGDQLRGHGVLSGADRELATLAAVCEGKAHYAWAAHEDPARREGARPEAIEIVRARRPLDGLTAREATIVDTVRSLAREHRLTDEQFARAEAEFGREALIELVAIAGLYAMVGTILNAFEIEPAEGSGPTFAD